MKGGIVVSLVVDGGLVLSVHVCWVTGRRSVERCLLQNVFDDLGREVEKRIPFLFQELFLLRYPACVDIRVMIQPGFEIKSSYHTTGAIANHMEIMINHTRTRVAAIMHHLLPPIIHIRRVLYVIYISG